MKHRLSKNLLNHTLHLTNSQMLEGHLFGKKDALNVHIDCKKAPISVIFMFKVYFRGNMGYVSVDYHVDVYSEQGFRSAGSRMFC